MYEKLDRLRADVEKLKAKIEDDKNKLRLAEQRLKEAENAQILADVGAMNLTPEQLAQFLQMVQSGQLSAVMQGTQTKQESEKKDSLEEREDSQDEYLCKRIKGKSSS